MKKKVLFVNAAFREGSRTYRIAKEYLSKCDGDIDEVSLGECVISPINKQSLKLYNESVKTHNFDDNMFSFGKQFAMADEIVIAAPFWNMSIPAVLHTYLELVCSQGVTFDMGADGSYHSLCNAKKLVFITTAGGYIPENDHAFSFIKSLCETFWDISDVNYYKAEGLDIVGTDVEERIMDVINKM